MCIAFQIVPVVSLRRMMPWSESAFDAPRRHVPGVRHARAGPKDLLATCGKAAAVRQVWPPSKVAEMVIPFRPGYAIKHLPASPPQASWEEVLIGEPIGCCDHVLPASPVVTATPWPAEIPKARQWTASGQAIVVSIGRSPLVGSRFHSLPALRDTKNTPLFALVVVSQPVAKQTNVVVQAAPERRQFPAGSWAADHVAPPSRLNIAAGR